MAKESTMQLRMDSGMKERVEALYHSMGTSFAEGIRMFAGRAPHFINAVDCDSRLLLRLFHFAQIFKQKSSI